MVSVLILIFLQLLTIAESAVAPRDENQLCRDLRAAGVVPIPAYSANTRILMDSWNYRNLLPDRVGAVWDQVDNDNNNPPETTANVSYKTLSCTSYYSIPCY